MIIIGISPKLTNFSFKDTPQFHFLVSVFIMNFLMVFFSDPLCQDAHFSILVCIQLSIVINVSCEWYDILLCSPHPLNIGFNSDIIFLIGLFIIIIFLIESFNLIIPFFDGLIINTVS